MRALRASTGHGSAVRWIAGLGGLAAAAYATYIGSTWSRYGKARRSSGSTALDRFLPEYDLAERHETKVAAPAEVTYRTARAMDLQRPFVVRAIFRCREWLMGARNGGVRAPRGVVDELTALGWTVLEEHRDREIVLGTVTQPWKADVVFRALPPESFASFQEPGFVKIVVSLRADPAGEAGSVFGTETRVAATDGEARARFRMYWALLSPGILLIRRATLFALRKEVERAYGTSRAAHEERGEEERS